MVSHSHSPSERQLNAALEEVSIALEIKSIQVAVAVSHFKSNVVRKVPVDHRSDPAERASPHVLVIEVDVGVSKHDFPCSRVLLGIPNAWGIRLKISSYRVVNASSVIEQVRYSDIASMEQPGHVRSLTIHAPTNIRCRTANDWGDSRLRTPPCVLSPIGMSPYRQNTGREMLRGVT